jgi:NADH-quinone oxidoreductase subunit N
MKSENIHAFNGLFFKRPILAVALTIGLLSMASIPPLAGFWGKYYILTAALGKDLWLIVLIAIFNTVLSIYFYFRVFVAMYGRKADGTHIEVGGAYKAFLIFLVLLLIVISLMPDMISSCL